MTVVSSRSRSDLVARAPLRARPVCLVHPGRSVLASCKRCRRFLCSLCLYRSSPFCSRTCLEAYVEEQGIATPRLLYILCLSALGLAGALLAWLVFGAS